jgi:hypothetical protein
MKDKKDNKKLVAALNAAASKIAKEGRQPKASYIPLNFVQVKLGEIFECEGRLYSIVIPESASVEATLEGGRCILQLHLMQ